MCIRYTLSLYHKTLAHFWGDKVSMLEHTHPHKPLRKIKVAIYSQPATYFMYGLMSDPVICKFTKV